MSCGQASPGAARHGRHGRVWIGVARRGTVGEAGKAGQVAVGEARTGMAGMVRSGWQVRVRSGQDGYGKVWQARMAGRVWYWPGAAGTVR